MRDLWTRARRVGEAALGAGSLGPIETDVVEVEDGGVRFALRVVSSLRAKDRAARSRPRTTNPFAPYEETLFVDDVGADHVLLLNKFPVFADHLLLVTRAFAPQEAALTDADFAALARCTDGVDALAFYNGGREAGASQPHRHLQLVPPPTTPGPPSPLSLAARGAPLPFAAARAPTPEDPRDWPGAYRALLARAGVTPPAPYNLLWTRAWMLVVPRTRESFEGISVNALGFAGSLLARDRAQLARLREVGPVRVLRHVSA
ncbi:MAG TPA: DUF4922 domain-containing protein [Sandaracinaceae bacterium LLY-WYZ-13_1]|nr:DUF4922 domain-containing protein [Sandaracinaceae bacterium LLY-WYZ-13_1]